MVSPQSVAKAVAKPSKEARQEILKVFRGMDMHSKNTIFVNIWTGEVQSHAYYRGDKGEYLSNQPKDCYEFHVNKFNKLANYESVDEQIEQQYAIAKEAIADELEILNNEIGREMQIWESEQEFHHSQRAMKDRLEELRA